MFVRARVFGTLGSLLGFLALIPPWFRGCDLRAVCQTAGATAWASDWAAPGLVAFLLPALGNGAWVILLTLHIKSSRRTRGGTGSGAPTNGAFGVPARLVRPLGRLAGALAAIIGAFVAYLTYENASETARAASAGVGVVTPRTPHVGWYLAIFANGVTAFAGFVACVFGRGAVCGPSKKQLSARVADDELLRVISTKPTPTQVGVTPRGERVMRVGVPAPSGEAHRKHGGAFARQRAPERMEKPRSFSHASRVSERERARERAARERAAANARAGAGRRRRYGGAAYAGEASGSEADTSSGEEGTSSDESSETYEDVERGRRHARTGARARVPEPAGGQGGWENWKAAFWKSSAGAAAAAAARAAGGVTGSGSASGDVRTISSGVSAPEEDMAYRAERDARVARLKSLAKSPETRAARPRALAFDQLPKPPIAEESSVRAAMRAHAASSRRDRSPAPVYELSSSDEEFLEPPRPSESPDSVAEARSPLLSPERDSGTRARLAGSDREPLSLRQRAELGNRA